MSELKETKITSIKTKALLISKEKMSHDVLLMKFRFVGEYIKFRPGSHFAFRHTLKTWDNPNGETLIRKYTPLRIASEDTMDVLVKIYRPNTHPEYMQGGKFTPFLEMLEAGQDVQVEGPLGKLRYQKGVINVPGSQKNQEILNFKAKKIVFIAGGSGIAPVYQLMKHIAEDPDNETQMVLLFANKSQNDIVLKPELDALKHRAKINYMVDKGGQGWQGFQGYVRKQVLQTITKLDQPSTLYAYCGPSGMNKSIKQIFAEYPGSKIYKF